MSKILCRRSKRVDHLPITTNAQRDRISEVKKLLRNRNELTEVSTNAEIFIDVDCSKKSGPNYIIGTMMSLTRRRAEAGGWFMLKRGRRMTSSEMLRAQGISPTCMEKAKYLPSRALMKAIGNAMSANVLERMLTRVLYATGLSEKREDKWKNADVVKKGGHFASNIA